MRLEDFRNIPFTAPMLDAVYPEYRAITAKAKRLEDSNKIIRLKRGLYVVNPETNNSILNEFLIANHLYGPSYVSRQSALRYYGLIPERVYEITSMTTGHAKTYSNKIGNFSYLHCHNSYYHIGVKSLSENGISFMIASPEKALCDLMVYTPNLNLRYKSELISYLEEDIRFDISQLKNFDLKILEECLMHSRKKTMIQNLIKLTKEYGNI